MLSSSSSVFDTLPTRPPTPPRDITKAVDDAISYLDDSNEIERTLKGSRGAGASTETSTQPSPPSSQGEVSASANAAKRVDFTPRPTFHQIARAGQLSSPSAQLRKRMPSRRDAKPLKSILKRSTLPPPLTPDDLDIRISYFSPKEPGSLARMLQSVLQQLAGQCLKSRLDAYLALNGALREYEGVPDPPAMAAKMSLLMQFITRDVAWKTASGALDVNLVTQALKLTAAILYNTKLSAALDDDFREFLIDRSIAMMEHTDIAKAIIKNHMFLLAQQRFHPRIMTAGRAERMINTLQSIEDKCSGNGAAATRLVIYQKLLEQRPAVMLSRMRDWLEPVLHGMLSSIKEVRIRAIETCTQAGLALGTHPLATKALLDIFNHEVEEAQSYCDYLGLRLMQMIAEKEVGAYVPQIWSAVILFFRNKRYSLEKWTKFKTWLMIIQKCLNSSDLTIRYQGHLAWNKLVFTVTPDSSLGRNMFQMLKVPPKMGMDKRGSDAHSKQVRQYALDSYYILLHYGLRPGLSHEELDSAWDVYVEPILAGMIKANGKPRYLACGVVHGLCTSSTGLWNISAANEATAIKPEELPKLEPRWVRSRLARILKLIEPILLSAMWMASENTAAVDATWHALMQSVAEAGGQEVKTSNELKEAIALLVNLFGRLWAEYNQPPAGAIHGLFTQRYNALLSTAVQCIGPGPFAEDILTKTKGDAIQAALTPSHRSSKHHSVPRSPLVLLFGLFYETPADDGGHDAMMEIPTALLRLLVSARPSLATRMELLQRSAQTWTSSYAGQAENAIAASLWACVACCATGLLEAPHSSANEHDSQSLGLELRNATCIFAQGMRHIATSAISLETALLLFDAMFTIAKAEAGTGGTVLAVIEPSAKAVLEAGAALCYDATLRLTTAIIRAARWPRSRQELDQSRRKLWGVGLAPHKSTTFDPFDHLYQLVNDAMTRSYNSFDGSGAERSHDLLDLFCSIMSFLEACPVSLLAAALRKVQPGFIVWVQDAARKTAASNTSREQVSLRYQIPKGVVTNVDQICSTWEELLHTLDVLPQKDTTLLKALEPLVIAGFSSPHKAIVNQTITFWNASFGCQETLDYPPELERLLRAWAVETDLALPNFPESDDEDAPALLPAFFETQTQASLQDEKPETANQESSHESSRVPSTAPVVRSTHFSVQAIADAGRPTSSPAAGRTKVPVRFTAKARLRHDDSQVQFASIESSPVHFDDSQMLTERQREVKARQRGDAQMFPDLSSSPAAKLSSSARSIQKRLDFTSDRSRPEDEEYGGADTPTALPDADGPMSDDIPSSPTPSSTKDVESARMALDEDHDTEMEDACDPPSSPPQQADDEEEADEQDMHNLAEARTSVDVEIGLEGVGRPDNALEANPVDNEDLDGPSESTRAADQSGSDFPSDTLLPAEQLLHEEEVAAKLEEAAVVDEETEGTTFLGVHVALPEVAQPEDVQDAHIDHEARAAYPLQEPAEGDVTRVENSFVEDAAVAEGGDGAAQPDVTSQQSQRSTRKRKRPLSTVHASKKRKQQTPLKQAISFFSSFVRRSQEEDEDDMEDEIVVASSQPSYSPASARAQQATSSPSKLADVPLEAAKEPAVFKDDRTPSHQSQKRERRRGRPRKSETPTPALGQAEAAPVKGLKRKASALSITSGVDEPATSLVKDIPAPSKIRKQRQGPDATLVQTAQLSQDEAELRRSTRRTVAAVIVPGQNGRSPADDEAESNETEVEIAEQQASPERQLASALNDRVIAMPRSILGRLRDVLADLPKMILGAQEEREADDVLFEIRKAVYEAGKRARE
ncbi:hypothetical protein LTR36_006438 [Oleoguttula mirabilis]|uniref:Telomere-associated protein Rif1 N-terminal domain-containing protein n=1 Tax=Oleoguttula mirabilis TaxID=1507867 RepID=A0AAV9JWM9_9PEZI|nr:hypothetical protein LTR36_006438 [Oleoguttula mirabilis]